MNAPRLTPRWLWLAAALTLLKLWLTRALPLYGIGPAVHDDRLFAELAAHLARGEWLGPYTQLTLAKGPMFPLFMAGNFWLGLPLGFTQQLLYALACALLAWSLHPWLRSAAATCATYLLLLWNPMSYEGGVLTRLMRQNLATPLALLVFAGLIVLATRRREPFRRQAAWAALAGGALGCFWLTREESVWLLPGVAVLGLAWIWGLWRENRATLRTAAAALALCAATAALPLLAVCSLNARHYGWFGTVEFRAAEFKAAYGSLLRVRTGPELPLVAVTRQMRAAAYTVSPAFAELRPHFEGPVGDHWADTEHFPGDERQIRAGWFMWALRDAAAAAGHAHSAGEALAFYQRIADELNAACDAGRIPASPRRQGFLPPLPADFITQLTQTGRAYVRYFLTFDAFTTATPDSQGDYAELQSTRDFSRERLSYAPRTPAPPTPLQDHLNQRKLAGLDWLGGRLVPVLGWLVLLAHVAAGARLLEAFATRRFSFPQLVALAAWLACAADLTINLLVHITSFYNLSPAALASAYPLLLLFVVATTIDAFDAWVRPRRAAIERAPSPRTPTPRRTALWLWAAGAAGLVLAARLVEIRRFTGDVPFNDQWKIEAVDLLAPWLHGTLRPWDFFVHHFEHVPAWTRFTAWAEVALTGRWDPLVQTTVNAFLFAGFAALLLRWVAAHLRLGAALGVTGLFVLGAALPHAWENIAWGFQSQFPYALLFLFLHLSGSFAHAAGSRRWWWAQAAGLAGLFTLAGMWIAPLAVVAVWLWTEPRGPRGRLSVPAALVVFGLALILIVRAVAPAYGAFAQTAGSPLHFVHALLDLLGWPAGWAGAGVLLNLPLVFFALQLRGRADATAFDRTVLALGLWAAGQAAALAYARSADYGGYVSRYGELLAVLVLANSLALARLVPAARRLRPAALIFVVLWSAVVLNGLLELSTSGHAAYFHDNAVAHAQIRRDAVQAYVQRHDRSRLADPGTRWLIFQDVDMVTGLLDDPDFRALLPHSVAPANPPDTAGAAVRSLHARAVPLAALAGLVFLAGVAWTSRAGATSGQLADFTWRPDALLPWAAGGTALVAGAWLLCWPSPFVFAQPLRWAALLQPATSVGPLQFKFVGASQPFPDSRLSGAAPLTPPELRNLFAGTAPEGPELTCTVWSSPFRITTPWLIVPHAGFPIGHGNGLRLRIEEPDGRFVTEVGCLGPNPREIGFWAADVRAYAGRQARVVLYDGRKDTEAWVAAAPPIAATDPALATQLEHDLARERLAPAHTALAWLALAASGVLLLSILPRRAAYEEA